MQQFFKDYLDHIEKTHNDFKNAIAGLSVEALDWVPGKEMNSLCVLVVHTMGAARYWVGDVAAQIMSDRDRATEFQAHGMDEAALVKKLDDTLIFIRDTLEKFTVQDLDAQRTSRNHPGKTFTVGYCFVHALEHDGEHLGHAQITRQLWDQKHG